MDAQLKPWITKYKLQKFVAERYDRNTGKFNFAQHITFQQKVFQSNELCNIAYEQVDHQFASVRIW